MSEGELDRSESLEDIADFLSGVEAFQTLSGELARIAAAVTHGSLRAGETMIVEGGPPSGSSASFATAPWTSCAGTPWSP